MIKPNALIIVESPAKARTLSKFLGSAYEVTSSMGHIIDLPRRKMGIDFDKDFEPTYEIVKGRLKVAQQLFKFAQGKDVIYLATDPDREGEAISWHIATLLHNPDMLEQAAKAEKRGKKTKQTKKKTAAKKKKAAPKKSAPALTCKLQRVTFHEITKQAILKAIQHPGEIDQHKVSAQQARRILDRLVGYSLSPLLWKKVGRGLSAGRVQSVAMKIIVDREHEIEAFTPVEYWSIDAIVSKHGDAQTFAAHVDTVDGQKAEITTQDQAEAVVQAVTSQQLMVNTVERKERKQHPRAPFITSTLQQTAYNKLRFSAAKTMRMAQQLYEGIETGANETTGGLITYMRTDSVQIAKEALSAVREYVAKDFGADYLPEKPNTYKSKKSAQEAHEAIRPTDVTRTPESLKSILSDDQMALYQLIWSRFVASQMTYARYEATTIVIGAGQCTLKATGRVPIFLGFLKAYGVTADEDGAPEEDRTLPSVNEGDALDMHACTPEQHFTKPPARFTDASLVRVLEENGIGRPSTYAPTIQTVVDRDYVRRQGGSLCPTHMGMVVTELLAEHFPNILNMEFTAELENLLDAIEDGRTVWSTVLRDFYGPFEKTVEEAKEKMRDVKREVIPADEDCPKCNKPMVIKWSRFGQFISCSDFPTCREAKPLSIGVECQEPDCDGSLVQRRSKRGRVFYGCNRYPKCTFATNRVPKGQVKSADGDATSGTAETQVSGESGD